MKNVREKLARMRDKRIVVLGDPVLDCYIYGTTHRISREAPVLVVREENREHRLGGAANTAANVMALGAFVELVGFVGHDEASRTIRAIAQTQNIGIRGLIDRAFDCTFTKTRVLAGGVHTTKQQMLRIDREDWPALSGVEREQLMQAIDAQLTQCDIMIVSDYGPPELTPLYVHCAQKARERGVRVVVDSRQSTMAFAGVTAVTPNQPEAEAALGCAIMDAAAAEKAAQEMLQKLRLDAVILTRGREGMVVAQKDQPPCSLVAFGGHEAVDVTGAGDTVTATFALGLAAGFDALEAAQWANRAASVVVRKIGAACCSPEELERLDS